MFANLKSRFMKRTQNRKFPRLTKASLGLTYLEARENPVSLYNLTWLGTVSAADNYSSAAAINDNGQVVGMSGVQTTGNVNGMVDPVGPYQAYAWTSAGGMKGLGTLNGSESYAAAINNSGEIAGTYNYYTIPYTVNGGGYYEWAWYYNNGVMSTIPGHNAIGGHSRAQGINDAGVVVGVADPTGLAYKYDGSTFTTLGTLGGMWSQGTDINNKGWVAGFADTGANPSTQAGTYVSYYHATIWSPTGTITDLGTLGTESYATKINDNGFVVGYSIAMDQTVGYLQYHPFLYNGTKMIDIGTSIAGNGFAYSINNAGQVVGGSGNPSTNTAWIYDNNTMYDLSTLIAGGLGSDTFLDATDINNAGQIVGTGIHNGHSQAFILNPTSTITPTVTINNGTFTYDGSSHSLSATVTGTGGVNVPGTVTYTYNGSATPPSNAGTYTVVATFTSTDPAYSSASATATMTIKAAVPTVKVNSLSVNYDGLTHPASATVTGVNGLPVSGSLTFTYNGVSTLPTIAGNYAVIASFTSNDANYTNAVASGTVTINAIIPTGNSTADIQAGQNINITKMAGNQHTSSISINPTNPTHLFSASVTEGVGIVASMSIDSGATWNNRIINYPAGAGAVETAYDHYGNLYLSYLTYSRTSPSSYVAVLYSTDDGATFTILPPVSATFASMPAIAVGPNSVWLAYFDAHSNSIIATGASIAGMGQIGSFSSYLIPGSFGATSPAIAVGNSGQVLVSYQISGTASAGPNPIAANLNPSGLGGTFGNAIPVGTTQIGGWDTALPAEASGIDAGVSLAWDHSNGAHRGRVYMVYTDAPDPASSASNIYLRYSDDSGASWSLPKVVTDDTSSASKFHPSISVDPTTGSIGISWYDTRNDHGNLTPGDTDGIANDDAQLWTTFSRDGGNSFLANAQVSSGTSNAADSEPPPFPWLPVGYGYFNRSDFYNGKYYRVWADNSNSTGDNPAGALKTMDVYTSAITLVPVASINVTGLNVNATAGSPFTGAVATFDNVDTNHSAGSYTATINWGDGSTGTGVISGTSTLTITGSHTFANPGSYTVSIVVHDYLGNAPDGRATMNATVTSLGLYVGSSKEAKFWASNSGQTLIKNFNGGNSHTELPNWLSTNFPNLYGAGAGANNLTGKSNLDVASLFTRIWQSTSDGAYAQILTTALNVYASTTSLGGAQGAGSGFQVSATGEGARLFNVGNNGAAVGATNNTTLNVFQLLKAASDRAVNGFLYNGNSALISTAKTLFDQLNSI